MAAMRAPHRCNLGGMAGGGEPVVNRRPDLSALYRRFAGTHMACDQQHHPFVVGDRAFESIVDRAPCLIQIAAVQVEYPVRRDRTGVESPVPGGIQRCGGMRQRALGSRPGLLRRLRNGARPRRLWWPRSYRSLDRLTRQRADGRCDPRPKLRFVRVERAHAAPSLSGSAPATGRTLTCRPRPASLRARRPRTYQSGWGP